MGHYRKLAMWDGLFSHFIYSDVDTVLLAKVDFIFDLLRDYDFVTADSGYVPSVWNNSIQTSGLLSVEQIEYSANTGMVASTLHSLSIANICERVEDALRLAPYMCLMCQEQPLLNYLIVTSAKRYTSLDIIARKGRYPSVMCDYWAGFASAKSRQPKHPDHFPVCRVHWAGVDKPYRDCQGNLVVPPEMPLSSLWKHYRFLPQI
jgi:hypothetical protein